MKKQIGLVAFTALLITFVAFSGVASAQANNAGNSARATEFTSPMCAVCVKVSPMIQASAEKYGVKLTVIDVSTAEGRGIAQANSVTETPTLVVQGAQSSRLEGDMTQQQIDAAMQAAVGNAGAQTATAPSPVVAAKPTPTPTAVPTKVPTPTPKVPTPTPKVPTPTANVAKQTVVKQTETKTVVKQTVVQPTTKTTTTTQQPNIQVLQPQTQNQTTTKTTATQTVPEFSLLGLGAPALIIGAVYLVMRRK